MKILFINNEFPPIGGGGSILTDYLATTLVKKGHEIVVITSSFADLPQEEKFHGYTVIRTPAIRKYQGSSSYLELISFGISCLFTGSRVVSRFKPDIIQAFFSVPSGATAYLLSKIYRVPYAVYLGGSDVPGANPGKHGSIYPFITPLINHILKKSQFISACSDLLVDLVHTQLPNIKVHKIPNGVDTSHFTMKKLSKKSINIVGVGRIMPRKGFQFLIEGLGLIRKELPSNLHVTIVGSGDYSEHLKSQIKKYSLQKFVTLVQSVSYSKLKKYYQNAHVFCLPSLAEGMPLAMLEAMACGCALITTNVAGNQELVIDGVNGFLIEPGDSTEISKALLSLINNPKKIENMRSQSRKLSIQYDWNKIALEYEKIYSTIV